ncbi:class IV adenylate cyclase [Streptomyces sp. NPDC002308]
MIEAELKAHVHDPAEVTRRLDARAAARIEVYQDTYYDRPDRSLEAAGQELRVRTVHGAETSRTVLTYKGAAVDAESGSKPEHETAVEDADATHELLRGLGHVPVIAFEKRCRNYQLDAYGRTMLATLVQVPELEGVFLEVETMVAEGEFREALEDVRSILGELGIGSEDLTTETYTGAVAARRA